MNMTSRYITVLERELHYTEWGRADAATIVMWHGLARTGRDFDDLAASLARRYRVICPDTIGRGLSQWSPEPDREYCLAFYARLAAAFCDALDIARMHWVGTSMGGSIGIKLASRKGGALAGRIDKLVLNDNGPQLADAAIERIRNYAGNPAAFDRVSELEAYFRKVYAPYGMLTEREWTKLTETSARRLPDGRVTPHYDPDMVRQFVNFPHDYDLWPEYDALDIPLLCLRGANSDLLLAETAQAMRERGPRARVVEIAGCGHAPALNVPGQIGLVEAFLGA
ncbi:MAG TPA: alpha/beta hydrolase [Burkholderiales bacterium]|nr:alpha/beta hydrolase [Burkholderiales bacterium]